MKNYESPVIFDNEELAEGVYATGSGGSLISGVCYNHRLYCTYNSLGEHTITITGSHRANHQTDGQVLELSFDQIVTFQGTTDGGQPQGEQRGTKICIRYNNHYIEDDTSVAFGEIKVKTDNGVHCSNVTCRIICDGANS